MLERNENFFFFPGRKVGGAEKFNGIVDECVSVSRCVREVACNWGEEVQGWTEGFQWKLEEREFGTKVWSLFASERYLKKCYVFCALLRKFFRSVIPCKLFNNWLFPWVCWFGEILWQIVWLIISGLNNFEIFTISSSFFKTIKLPM